jgi:CRP-like cAMP-binding protein
MTSALHSFSELLIRKLESIGSVSEAERSALCRLQPTLTCLNAHEDLVREGERLDSITVLIQGYACRYKLLADGKRQIMAFHIPGDILDMRSFLLPRMDHSIGSITPSQLGVIPHAALHDVFSNQPGLAYHFWRSTLVDAAIFREWMVGIGRRLAFSRIAHLFCELIVRMQSVGLCSDYTIELPLRQSDIADAVGMSTVHVNRTLQELRKQKLIKFARGTLTAMDWPRLCVAGQFDEIYLH